MAAPLLSGVRTCKIWNAKHIRVFYRTLLSEEYTCDREWKKRMGSKFLSEMEPRSFGYALLRRFEKEKYISPMDMDLFANKINTLKATDDEMIEDVIHKFRHVDDSMPVNDCIHHTIVRAYIESDRVERLIFMMKNKVKYGIFPDFEAFCMLLDHLIKKNNFEGAASVAAEVMLQEDFSHKLCNLLCVFSLYQCYKRNYLEMPKEQTADTEEAVDKKKEEEEMEYIPVKIIWRPHYDDHFDIKDEKLLCGKSLYLFGKYTEDLEKVDARSLQLIGLALYEKFDLGLKLLRYWIDETSLDDIVHEEARRVFHDRLHAASVRDADAPPVPLGQKTLDDCAEELKPTEAEKQVLIEKYMTLHNKLSTRGLASHDLEESFVTTVRTYVDFYEEENICKIKKNYRSWILKRNKRLPKYMLEHERSEKMREIREKLLLLKEKEELLSFFKNQAIIDPYIDKFTRKVKKKAEAVDTEADQYVEAPGERNVKKAIMKK